MCPVRNGRLGGKVKRSKRQRSLFSYVPTTVKLDTLFGPYFQMQERAIKEDYWYANNLFLSGKFVSQHKITGSLNTWWFWCRDDLRNQQSQPLCTADDQVVGNEIKIDDDTVQWRDQDKVVGSSTTTEAVCAISCRVGTRGKELNFDTSRLHCNGEKQFLAASDSSICIFVIHQHQ